jgi:hypothetical protein
MLTAQNHSRRRRGRPPKWTAETRTLVSRTMRAQRRGPAARSESAMAPRPPSHNAEVSTKARAVQLAPGGVLPSHLVGRSRADYRGFRPQASRRTQRVRRDDPSFHEWLGAVGRPPPRDRSPEAWYDERVVRVAWAVPSRSDGRFWRSLCPVAPRDPSRDPLVSAFLIAMLSDGAAPLSGQLSRPSHDVVFLRRCHPAPNGVRESRPASPT